MDDEALRVLLISDSDVRISTIKRALSDVEDVEVDGASESIEDAASIVPLLHPDVIVADVFGEEGPEHVQALRSTFPELHVVAISECGDPTYAERILRAGALGFLSNSSALHEIADAVRSVARERAYVNRRVARKILRRLMQQTEEDPHSKLTNREREVFNLLGSQDAEQIADGLGLSARTVQGYLRSIRGKLNLASTSDLIDLARQWQSERA